MNSISFRQVTDFGMLLALVITILFIFSVLLIVGINHCRSANTIREKLEGIVLLLSSVALPVALAITAYYK